MKLDRTIKDYILFGEAWFLLAMARLMLVFLPFKKIIPVLGSMEKADAHEIENDKTKLHAIKLAIERGSRYSPWRAMCFEQALAAKMMLKRRRFVSTIFFGVYKDDDNKLNAHAWLQSGGQVITGGKNLEKFTVLSSFKS
jgi:hypothetical protein